MASQLLIDMPAEGAARLLTLSLIERLSQYALASSRNGNPERAQPPLASYRTTMRRLRAGMTLYGSALGGSLPRKARRRLRDLAAAAERLHRADVQLAWATRHVPSPEQRLTGEPLGDGPRAAAWLCDRAGRRRERALRALLRAQSDGRTLRRLAKRLGAYTTAVRLDTIPTHETFADVTGAQLLANAESLAAAMRAVRTPTSHVELRRALRCAEHLTFLVEPLRASAGLEEAGERLAALHAALEHLDDTTIVARAIVRGGRRLAADHAGDVLRAAIWPMDIEPLGGSAADAHPSASPADLQRGFVVLAEALHDGVMRSFHELEATWLSGPLDQLIGDVGTIAGRLRG